MDILITAFSALWQVAAVGLLLGAGLPALFALGVRSLNANRVLLASGTEITSRASAAGKAGAVVCFGITVLAALFGIVVIVFGKQLFGG
jgi:hypothetical protein